MKLSGPHKMKCSVVQVLSASSASKPRCSIACHCQTLANEHVASSRSTKVIRLRS